MCNGKYINLSGITANCCHLSVEKITVDFYVDLKTVHTSCNILFSIMTRFATLNFKDCNSILFFITDF